MEYIFEKLKISKEILKKVFGYSEFRSSQEEIIKSILENKDTLAIMPTGAGKSLCYQIPALISPGVTIIISPLISLMEDQIKSLHNNGIQGIMLHSSLSYDEYLNNQNKLLKNKSKFLFLSPETLLKPQITHLIKQLNISLVVIDEAHCISKWGHDFRPEYREIASIRSLLKKTPFLALTATATKKVQEDIVETLHLSQCKIFISSFLRKNLFIEIFQRENIYKQINQITEGHPEENGIIYCFSRKDVDSLYDNMLQDNNNKKNKRNILKYHAGLNDEERKKNHQRFEQEDNIIMIATVAFGMGINKPNVRFIIHKDLPNSIERYYQEIGRAGRDGLSSKCTLFYKRADLYRMDYLLNGINEQGDSKNHLSEKEKIKNDFFKMLDVCESITCRQQKILNHFDEVLSEKCQNCDNCLNKKSEDDDLTEITQKLLSCIWKVKQSFGLNHIINVLLGSKNKKIYQYEHQNLSVYGIGKECSRRLWLFWAEQCLQKKLIEIDFENFQVIKITQVGYDVLAGKEEFYGRKNHDYEEKDKSQIQKNSKSYSYSHQNVLADLPEVDQQLLTQLKTMRYHIAEKEKVPSYYVFNDKTLLEIIIKKPKDKYELLNVYGIGENKCNKYGEMILSEVGKFSNAV